MDTGPKNDSVARRWESVVGSKDSAYRSTSITSEKIQHLADSAYITAITDRVSEGSLCLETGCGSGSLSAALAAQRRKVIALDYTSSLLSNLQANRKNLESTLNESLPLFPVQADIESMPFQDNTFDAVFSEGVIEHWVKRPARLAVLTEMKRVLRPGGVLVLFVPNGRHPLHGWWKFTRYPGYASEDRVPWHRFSSQELAGDLGEAGFSKIDHDGISPWSTLAVWPDWLPFRAVAALCRRIFPEPIGFRRKWGFNLMALGIKPDNS